MQGGTFLNDAVLRAFENELGVDVVRPDIAGLMGAYGAALHAKEQRALHPGESTVLSLETLNGFTHNVKQARCGLCENHCRLTVNDFGGRPPGSSAAIAATVRFPATSSRAA